MIPFQLTYVFVAACIALVTVLVAIPMKEPKGPPRPVIEGSKGKAILTEIWSFLKQSYQAFIGTRAAFLGLIFALLPAGAFALGLSLQSNLAVELGMSEGHPAGASQFRVSPPPTPRWSWASLS